MIAMKVGQPRALVTDGEAVEARIDVESRATCGGGPSVQLIAIVRVQFRTNESERSARQRLRDELLDYLDLA